MEEYQEHWSSNEVVKGIGALLSKFKRTPIKKKRGGLNEITDLRRQTADLLKKPIGQVYGLTKGWSVRELYITLHTAQQFINPPALWWKLYKKNKDVYGQKDKASVSKVGKARRKETPQVKRQEALF